MLNKVRLVGKVLPFDHERKNSANPSILYFNLLVFSPNNLLIVVRCSIQKLLVFEEEEKLSKINEKDSLLSDSFVEIRGYIKNDESSRQFLVKITNLEVKNKIKDFEELNFSLSNQVRLLGRITEIDLRKSSYIEGTDQSVFNESGGLITFKISLGKDSDDDKSFFCRVQDELMFKFIEGNFQRGDVILVQGFLQTKKVSQGRRNFRISSIVCQSITLIDSYFSKDFYDINFKNISGVTRKINFNSSKIELNDD